MTYAIKTNNQPRDIIYGYELTEKEWEEFDYMKDMDIEERMTANFVRYKGRLYDLGDIMRVGSDCSNVFAGWHGYVGDSFFSGVLFKYTDDCDQVICATYNC